MHHPAAVSTACMTRIPSAQQIVRGSVMPASGHAVLPLPKQALLYGAETGAQAPAASPVSGPQDQGQDPSEDGRGEVTEG